MMQGKRERQLAATARFLCDRRGMTFPRIAQRLRTDEDVVESAYDAAVESGVRARDPEEGP
jgi:hypothetical protein